MTKLHKRNFWIFIVFFTLTVVFSYVINSSLVAKPEKPWHMQPFVNEDSLSIEYADRYVLLDKSPIFPQFYDSTKVMVEILVDAWGVPFDMNLMAEDFSAFESISHKEYLHYRMNNRTKHAEKAEYHHRGLKAIYLFGGDSLEYGRKEYLVQMGFNRLEFCQKCGDATMFRKLDSLLAVGETQFFAMTTQNSRDGNRMKLKETLNEIAALAQRHKDVRFVIQGTHRPILGNAKIRRKHYAHWVPVIIVD